MKEENYEMTLQKEIVPSPIFPAMDTTTLVNAIKRNTELHKLRQSGGKAELELEELERTIEVYLKTCEANKKTPTPAGLSAAIGLNHRAFLKALKSEGEKGECLRNAMEVIHAVLQEGVINNIVPVKVYTFLAKNYWELSDKEIVEHITENNDVKIYEIDSRINRLKRLSSLSNPAIEVEVKDIEEKN